MNKTAHLLEPEVEALLSSYADHLTRYRFSPEAGYLYAARALWRRFGGVEGFENAGLQGQLSITKDACTFVDWLIVTRRLVPSADYLVARRINAGQLLGRAYPECRQRLREIALGLGFRPELARRQWVVLSQICALSGVTPNELTRESLAAGLEELAAAARRHWRPATEHSLRSACFGLEATLFHAGVIDAVTITRRSGRATPREAKWAGIAPGLTETIFAYLDQMALSLRPSTMEGYEIYLRDFARFVSELEPPVARVADIARAHIEAYKATFVAGQEGARPPASLSQRLSTLRVFFERLSEAGHPDAPSRVPIFAGDFPIKDQPLPRFLDDASSAKLFRAARDHPDPFVRISVEMLARTGMRRGELVGLKLDAVVQIGSSYWLRVPVGKLHNDRFIPLHPQLKDLLDDWIASHRGTGLRSELIFIEKGRPISKARVDAAVDAVAEAAGLGNVTPHQLRHTLATQAVNRGMSLEAIAALLGHKSLTMTLTYARIANRTVAEEYFAVSEKVEALYGRQGPLPADAEGAKMAKLRREMNSRMLGNGYCTRPAELDCSFESICERCSFFAPTIEFRPTLQRQRDDAKAKGQTGRQDLFEGLLARVDGEAS